MRAALERGEQHGRGACHAALHDKGREQVDGRGAPTGSLDGVYKRRVPSAKRRPRERGLARDNDTQSITERRDTHDALLANLLLGTRDRVEQPGTLVSLEVREALHPRLTATSSVNASPSRTT